MQKHCIEITKAAVDLLNPGQVIVDVSDQPVYTVSRQLQQLYPIEFGPGRYFAMFGGLHIEKNFWKSMVNLSMVVVCQGY